MAPHHQISKATTLIFLMMLALCAFPTGLNARVLLQKKDGEIDSTATFQKMDFDLSALKKEMTSGRLLREVPGGPNPLHNIVPPPPKRSSTISSDN